MRIDFIRIDEDTELHIWSRHRVTPREVEVAVDQRRLTVRGRRKGVYEVYGRTEAGRYLTVIVQYLGSRAARLITAREMDWTERRRYEKHAAH